MSESRAADRQFSKRAIIVAAILLATAALGTALWIARAAVIVIYVSALIAIGLTPVVDRVAKLVGRRRKPASKGTATFLVYLAGAALVLLAIAFFVPAVLAQFRHLREDLPSIVANVQKPLVSRGLLSQPMTLQEAMQSGSGGGAGTAAGAARALLAIVGGFAGLVTIVFLSYYFVVEGATIATWALRFVPAAKRTTFRSIAVEVNERVAAWLRATLLLGAIMGTTAGLVLGIAGAPFFYVVAVIAALGEAVPMVGSLVAGIIAVGLAATKSGTVALIVAGLFFCLHEFEANILVPRMMEKRVGVSSAALIIALLVGVELGGVIGIVVAVPTAAIIAAVLDVTGPKASPDEGA